MKNAAEFIAVTLLICVALLLSALIVAFAFWDGWRTRRDAQGEYQEWIESGEL